MTYFLSFFVYALKWQEKKNNWKNKKNGRENFAERYREQEFKLINKKYVS